MMKLKKQAKQGALTVTDFSELNLLHENAFFENPFFLKLVNRTWKVGDCVVLGTWFISCV